jgi:hypothetical protein
LPNKKLTSALFINYCTAVAVADAVASATVAAATPPPLHFNVPINTTAVVVVGHYDGRCRHHRFHVAVANVFVSSPQLLPLPPAVAVAVAVAIHHRHHHSSLKYFHVAAAAAIAVAAATVSSTAPMI